MGYSNGQLETSSGTGQGERGEPGLPGIGFNLTDDGNFDLDSKRLTDVADPVDDGDAATKKYVDDHIHSGAVSKKYVDDENARQDIAINSKAGKDEVALLSAKDNIYMNNFRIFNLPLPSGSNQPATKAYVDGKNTQQDIAINRKAEGDKVLLLDGSKSMTGNLQMGKKKITDLGDGSDDGDAVNFSQLLSHTDNHQVNYHLQPSFTFYKNQTIINPISIPKTISNHNHLDLYIVSKVSSNNDFGGQAWVSLKMTNTLKAGLYTVVFETFAALSGSSTLNDETLITQVFGDAHFKIITFNHDWESDSGGNTPHSKAYIQFSSDGQSGEITFEIRYYGSSYNQNIKFLFFSRVISGRQNNNFNHALFDVNSVQYQNQIMYFEDINLNENRIIKLQDPIDDNDAVNKGYVDGKVVNADLTGYLRRDGSLNMTGNLKMDKKYIEDLETPNDVPITDLVNYRKDAYRAANKEYLRQNFLKKDENGGDDYDLKQNVIRNAEPYRDGLFGDNDLVSKAFVDAEIAKLPKNVLKLDGSQAMRGNLQMGDHTITGIRSSSQDDAALTVGGAKSLYLPLSGNVGMQGALHMGNNTIRNLKMPANNPSSGNPPDDCALNFKYFHSQRGDLERQINAVGSKAFSKDGSDPMEGKLDMNVFDIINLPTAAAHESSYAANVNYVNKTVSDNNATISSLIDSKVAEVDALNIKASKRENVFSFVMDDDLFKEDDNDITKVGKVEKDFYDINQATYEFTIDYDSKIGYYSTRLTIDLKALDIGEFTLVFEMYYDKSKIDKDEVVVDALSSSLNVSRHNTNKFSDHSRTIINFHKYGFLGLNDLDIDITLKNKSGVSYDPTATIFVVVYGVLGHQNDVDTRIWDRIYYVDNQNVKFEAAIDMNDHDVINVDNLSMNNFINMNDNQIKNLQDGNEDGDAVNVKQLNENESTLTNFINRKITEVKNEIPTAVKGVYFHTRNPVYNTYSTRVITKTMKWSSMSGYQWSGSNDFILNSDSITIRQRGLYFFYYQEKIKGSDNDKQKGYIGFDVVNSTNHEARFTERVGSSSSSPVFLNFYTYFNGGDKLRIRAYFVQQFGITSGSAGVSGLRYDENLIIKKII